MANRHPAQCLSILDLDARIDAVASDFEAGTDMFHSIPEFDLAELLGISDVRSPGGWPTWERVTYCVRWSLEEWAEIMGAPSCLVDFIPENIDPASRNNFLTSTSSSATPAMRSRITLLGLELGPLHGFNFVFGHACAVGVCT